MKGFLQFIREQGVVGLATGFILGGAISKFVSSIVNDMVNPLLGLILGSVGELRDSVLVIGSAQLKWGNLLASFIDFIAVALVVYLGFKLLKLDRIDKKK